MADDAPDKNDFTEHYNTELDPASETSFQDWMKGQSDSTGRDVGNDLYDYDMRGYWQQHLHDNAEEPPSLSGGHLTDEFKKPNHPTFSDQSKYHGMAGNEGGTWEMIPGGEPGVEAWSFKPGATNLEHHEPGRLKSYFDKVEPGNQLILPEAPAAQPNYLANQRARFGEEMQNNPRSRSRLRAILSLENEGAGPGVVESLMNRMAMTGGTLERGMGGGANSFYGPERKGLVEPRMREIERNPAWQARLDRSIDQALGGSNVIKGHTDQGSRGDPNYYAGGTGVNINGERFNHWGGHKGVEYSRQWTENQQRMVEAGGGAEPPTQMAEYKGKATPAEAEGWGTIGGPGTSKGQIEKNLQRGPMLVPKTAPGAEEFLKDNPDVEFKDYEDHWLIQPPKTGPLVAQSKAKIAAFGDYLRQVADLGGKIHVGELSSAAVPSKNIEDRTLPEENPDAEYARLAAAARVRQATKRR